MAERKEQQSFIGIPPELGLIGRQAKLPAVLSLKTKLALGILTIATAALLFACSDKPSHAIENKPTTFAPVVVAGPQYSPVVNRLNQLNQALFSNPDNIKNIVSEINSLATDYYCQNSACSSDELTRLKSVFELLPDAEFQKQNAETNWCTDVETDKTGQEVDADGFYYFRTGKIYLNIDRLLKDKSGQSWENPAYTAFDFSLHELGHARPPVLAQLSNNQFEPYTTESTPQTIIHGVLRLVYTPERNREGKPCYIAYRRYVEEAVVENHTTKLMKQLGLPKTPTAYSGGLLQNYQDLIGRNFRSNPDILFNFHQRSEDTNFVGNIGITLGYPKAVAVQEGDKFLAQYFNPVQ